MANANGWGDGASNNNIDWGQGADNLIGWGSVYSVSSAGATDIIGVVSTAPVNTIAPVISGTSVVGYTLSSTDGTWTGNPTPTYTYQWYRGASAIGSATNSTYTLVTADVGQNIKCTVTATNIAGSANADSNTVVPVAYNQYSLLFDGVDERINCGNIDTTNAMSISFWIKTTSTASLNAVIAKDYTGTTRSWSVLWRGSASGLRKLYFTIFHNADGSSSSFVESTANVIDDGNWHHVLVTFTGTTASNGLKMYLDGSLVNQVTAVSGTVFNNLTTPVIIGALSGGTSWNFNGKLDEIAIWNNDQSANASTIYNSGTPANLTSLSPKNWWRMGDGDTFSTNWTLTDNGSQGMNGTSINMELTDRTTDVP